MNRIIIKKDWTAYLVVFCCILFDWRFFELDSIHFLIYAIKGVLPFFLLIYVGTRQRLIVPSLREHRFYYVLMAVFLFYALLPSLLSQDPLSSLEVWERLCLTILYIYAIGAWLIAKVDRVLILSRVFVILGVVVVIQFLFALVLWDLGLVAVHMYGPFQNGMMQPFIGSYGLLGAMVENTTQLGLSFLRLVSYWYEPSKASGFLVPCFFFSYGLWLATGQLKWRVAAFFMLSGVFFCLSNAGYLALAAALLFGVVYRKFKTSSKRWDMVVFWMALFLIGLALLGRLYVYFHPDTAQWLRIITGVRGSIGDTTVDAASGGRIDLAMSNFNNFGNHPFGIGLMVAGEGSDQYAGSATAPIMWLVYTGIIGLGLLISALWQVPRLAWRIKLNPVQLTFFQAWVGSTAQQLVYGTWMTPFYFSVTLICFSIVYFYQR